MNSSYSCCSCTSTSGGSSGGTLFSWAAPYILCLLTFLFLLEQISYLRKKSHLPGPSLITLPFLGNALSLVTNPTKFWDTQSNYAKSTPLGISSNYIVGKHIVFISNTELCHKIFSNVRPDAFHLVGHPFGKKLFGQHNMIYMFGQDHKDLRRRIAPNFTPKALSTYTCIQQRVIIKHLSSWLRLSSSSSSSLQPPAGVPGSNPIPLRILVRDMNLETSQTVFAGPYLGNEERERFNVDYSKFNVGLMKLPFDFPGCAFRNARLAVDRLIDTLTDCVRKSKAKILAGFEPECLVDFWMQDTVREEKEAAQNGRPPPPHSGDREIGGHLFDFLFAAQDASTSSLLWAITLLDSRPHVLSKVHHEVATICSSSRPRGGSTSKDHEIHTTTTAAAMGFDEESNSTTIISADMLHEMRYTQAVAREVLRLRPPATMVPHIAGQDFALTDHYTVPKGTIVFPSVFESSFQGFTHPDRFDPDRFYLPERQEDQLFRRNFLVFGAGPHQCVGQRYAINHLVLFIALFVTLIDFKRHRSHGCDDIAYVPTICPKDDCMVFLSANTKK